jgi:hypothetical protein
MRPDQTTNALGALLQVLEEGERRLGEKPFFPPEVKREPAVSNVSDQSANRLVERIASAMLRLHAQEGY